jgi:hypothetical protein
MNIFLKLVGQQLLQALVPNLLAKAEKSIAKITTKVKKINPDSFKGVLSSAATEIVTNMYYSFSSDIKQSLADGTITKKEANAALQNVGELAEAQLKEVAQKLPEEIIPIVIKDVPATIKQTYEILKRRGELASQNEFYAKALAAQAK